jgi:acetoin utilization protein AcuB
MIVKEIMTPEPYAADVTSSVRHVLRMMTEADVRHLPILEEGALVGIVSDRDLRALDERVDSSENPEMRRQALAEPISTIMSSSVVSVSPDDEVADVIDLMIEHRIGAVPVVESGSDKLVGIVSYVDALRVARNFL